MSAGTPPPSPDPLGLGASGDTQPDGDLGLVVDTPDPVELSPTEKGIESLRGKLTGHRDEVSREKVRLAIQLGETRTTIDRLETRLAELKTEVMTAHAEMNQAMGLTWALRDTVVKLREEVTGQREGGETAELRSHIQTELSRARSLAVELVGDSPYTEEYLQSPTLEPDEGKAGGLVQEIKNDFRVKVAERNDALSQAARARVMRKDSEYRDRERAYEEAEDRYRNATIDLSNAEDQRDSLIARIQQSRETVRVLEATVQKIDLVAQRIEEQGRKHERKDMSAAAAKFEAKRTEQESATRELDTAKTNAGTLQGVIEEYDRNIARLTDLVGKIMTATDVYSRAVDAREEADGVAGKLLVLGEGLAETVRRAREGIDEKIVRIGDEVREKIERAVGQGTGEALSAHTELNRALGRLDQLTGDLERNVTLADKNVPPNLNWEAVESVVESSTALKRFIESEWPRVQAGNTAGFITIEGEVTGRLADALGSLTVLQRVCREIRGNGKEPEITEAKPAVAAAPAPAAEAPAAEAAGVVEE